MSAKSPSVLKEGALVLLAGKLDTLVSDFALDQIPSGSEDPHGLRRQALGAVRIILENGFSLDLRSAVSTAFAQLPAEAPGRAADPLLDFIWQRAEVVFSEAGYRFDEVKTVREFFLSGGDLLDCRDRVKDINAMRGNPDFAGIAMAFKRAKNILRQAKAPSAAPDELVRKDESALFTGL